MQQKRTGPDDGLGDKRLGLLIVCCLSALAGAVDASGFYLLKDLYVSFMSGNTTSMAAAFARGDMARVGLIAGIIAAFVAGAAVGAVIGVLAGWRHVPVGIFAAALVLVVPVVDGGWAIQAMAFAMGMLNTTIRQAGSVEVAVTYVTGTLAKFGRGLGLYVCGRTSDWSWVEQGVPWIGLVAGAAVATLALVHLGERTFIALPAAAALIGIGSWFALPAHPAPADG